LKNQLDEKPGHGGPAGPTGVGGTPSSGPSSNNQGPGSKNQKSSGPGGGGGGFDPKWLKFIGSIFSGLGKMGGKKDDGGSEQAAAQASANIGQLANEPIAQRLPLSTPRPAAPAQNDWSELLRALMGRTE